jgi:hypothetical protein
MSIKGDPPVVFELAKVGQRDHVVLISTLPGAAIRRFAHQKDNIGRNRSSIDIDVFRGTAACFIVGVITTTTTT